MTDHIVPPIGMRMVKSAAAVLICLLISMAVDREDMRIYSSIAALLCVQPYAEDTRRMAVQRTVGTAIGSVFGIATLLLEMVLDIRGTLTGYILIAAVTVPALWISVALKAANAAALSGIVFLSITVTHVTDASPWIFAWYRASETLVGIVVGIAVNAFQLPRRKRTLDRVFSGLDGLLLTDQETLTPYSLVRLNRMLDDGMQFTLSTMRTPASVRETTRDPAVPPAHHRHGRGGAVRRGGRSGISTPASCPRSWPCGVRRCSRLRASTASSTACWTTT